jgi:hypothetical protein
VTVIDKVVIGLQEEEQAAVSERAMNWSDRRNSGMFPCLIHKRVCLQKKENCEKGDAQ